MIKDWSESIADNILFLSGKISSIDVKTMNILVDDVIYVCDLPRRYNPSFVGSNIRGVFEQVDGKLVCLKNDNGFLWRVD